MLPHGTTPAAVKANKNKNKNVSSIENNENTRRQSVDHIARFWLMNPRQ